MNINIISRGKGKSAVAAAAYRAGEIIKNEYDGEIHDYSKKKGVVHTQLFLPVDAPDFYDRAELWNSVEKIEKAKNAQLAREVRVALPNELSLEQNINLVHEYVRDNFVYHGMVADYCIHDKGDGNPHAHIMLTMRPFEKDGTWGEKSRMEYILDDNGERQKLPSGRYKVKKITTTDWDSRDNAELWRKNWADTLNKYLDKEGHIRVDHRSFERQGLGLIPTIHLGVTAHQMEQKGIATERGDINRRINEDNARLREINGEIRTIKREQHSILNPPQPPKPQFIINLENSIKAQNSVGYEKWATLFNLQQMAKTLIYIQENGYTDIISLQVAHQTAKADITNILTQLDDTSTEIRRLKNQKDATEAYRRTVDVWKEYNSNKWWRQSSKDKFYEDNKADIEDYKAARDYIYVDLKLEKFPNLKTLSGKISELTTNQKDLRKSLSATIEKEKTLTITTHNARMALGYKNLEEQGTDPTATHHNTPLYQSSFAQAEKSSELDLYFQSQAHNKNCADDIKNALPAIMAGHNKALEDVIGSYGADRITWVLAHVIANDTADGTTSGTASATAAATMSHAAIKTAKEFAEHKDWVSQVKLPNEPILEYDLKCNAALSTFINKFQEYMRMFRARRAWEQGQTQSLSMADKFAIAKEKANEHNQSRVAATVATATPKKPKKKNYGHEI